ncbi:MAG TPA: hypothetical protein VF155_07055, partial [Candidatus Dormibacteraeota bacterium]
MRQRAAAPSRARAALGIAAALVAMTLALTALAWYLASLNNDLNVITSQFGPDLIIGFGLLPVALLIITRRRDNVIGWLFLTGSFVGSLHAASGEYAIRGLLSHPALPATAWAAWVSGWIIDLVFPTGIVLFIVLLFPSGRLVSRRWRSLAVGALLWTALLLFITLPSDYPIMIAPGLPAIASPVQIHGLSQTFFGGLWVAWPAGILLLLNAGAGIVVRYRRSSGEERQQVKWFAYAIAITLVAYAATIPFGLASTYNSWISNLVLEAGFGVALPVACAI